jgi:hypothetical protein
MAVTLSSSTKQPAKPTISHWRFGLESAIARAIAEGKVRTYEKHVRSLRRHGLAPPRRAGCGEGGKDSTLNIAKAIADYASS